jgi:hypothetical protein
MAAVSDEMAKTVCKTGCGKETCAYLTMGPDGWECLKGTSLEHYAAFGRLLKTMTAQGDNCPGADKYQPPRGEN